MAQQLTPQTRFSTHDWTAPIGTSADPLDFVEAWADAKSPGDGRTYVVGTVQVQSVDGSTTRFSTQPAVPSAGLGFSLSGANVRQVAFVQVNDPTATATAGIDVQKFFYGHSGPLDSDVTRATNGRGISVWPAADRADTRVVICGETFDERLPQSQLPNGWNSTSASGFIAVYDGNLQLKWTHHLFGVNPDGASAVTDVSVRVAIENGVPVDVITYCGISTHGNPSGGNASLTPIRAFSAASPAIVCPGAAGGTIDNGLGQWDGFVGRVVRNHDASGATDVRFHSVVGGSAQDGLFGISEMAGDRFAVVGSTAAGRPGIATGPGNAVFPFTKVLCPTTGASYCMGTAQVFDASSTSNTPPGPLVLVVSGAMGEPGELSTIARDVVARASLVDFDPNRPGREDVLFVVGSTTDGTNTLALGAPIIEPFVGGTEGFLQVLFATTGGFLLPGMTTYRGGSGADGLTGVNGWNEYLDQVVVTGFRQDAGGNSDIDVASYFMYAGGFNPAVDLSLRPLRAGQLGGENDDRPTVMGLINATNGTTSAPRFETFGLGDPAGGGVAQDERGRVSVVGRTLSVPPGGYPVVVGRARSTTLTPAGRAAMADAVRSEVDLLPAGVGRTDGTGPVTPAPGLPFPLAGTNGGTTPPCALTEFGNLLGLPQPAANRLLIDYEGPPPAGGSTAGIVVVRAPVTTGVVVAALQVGFPGDLSGNPLPLLDGVELWTPIDPFVQFYFPSAANVDKPFRDVIVGLPATATFTVQVAFLLGSPVTAGNPDALPPIPCGGSTFNIVSPALWISY